MAGTPATARGPTAHPHPLAGCSHPPSYILFSTGKKTYRFALCVENGKKHHICVDTFRWILVLREET